VVLSAVAGILTTSLGLLEILAEEVAISWQRLDDEWTLRAFCYNIASDSFGNHLTHQRHRHPPKEPSEAPPRHQRRRQYLAAKIKGAERARRQRSKEPPPAMPSEKEIDLNDVRGGRHWSVSDFNRAKIALRTKSRANKQTDLQNKQTDVQ
jgi:hypothetical protein